MSGLKYSYYNLDPERERRSQLVSQIAACRREMQGVRSCVEATLRDISPSIESYLADETEAARQWLTRLDSDSALRQGWNMNHSSTVLSAGLSQVQRIVWDGKQVQEPLDLAFNKIKRRRLDLKTHLTKIESAFNSHHKLIRRWIGEEAENRLQAAIDTARQLVKADDFPRATEQIEILDADFQECSSQAQAKESQQIRQEQARALAATRRELGSAVESLQHQLDSSSMGLQETFEDEVKAARQWLHQAEKSSRDLRSLGDETSEDELRAATNHLRDILREGQSASVALQQALTEQANHLRAQGEKQVTDLELCFEGGRELVGFWFGDAEEQRLAIEVRRVRETLDEERLRQVELPCRALQDELNTKLQQAEAQEEKHLKRKHLLAGLRQVCSEMGFRESEPPCYEREGDRSSRIIMVVDTFDRGLVTFHLSLEGVRADSCMATEHCFEEFDKLSHHLANEFGVQTRFQMANGEPRPELRRKGEKDEPGGTERTTDAG